MVEYSFIADSSDEVTVICQGYGSELVADLKGGTGAEIVFRDTPDACHTLMCSPELVHFGRYNLNPDFNPAEARSVASSGTRSEEHTSELKSQSDIVCRLLLEKQN